MSFLPLSHFVQMDSENKCRHPVDYEIGKANPLTYIKKKTTRPEAMKMQHWRDGGFLMFPPTASVSYTWSTDMAG